MSLEQTTHTSGTDKLEKWWGWGWGGWSGLERILIADCLCKIYFFPPPPSLFNSQSLTIIKNATKQ